jgi:AcrR family transcriptional regulator
MNTEETFATALHQLTVNHRFDEITVEYILQRAGYSRRTFYQHFKDKYDLLGYCYQTQLERIRATATNWQDVIVAIFQLVHDDAAFYTRVMTTDRAHTFEGLFCMQNDAFIQATIQRCNPTKFASDPDIKFSVRFFCAGLSQSMLDWLESGRQLPVAVIAAQVNARMSADLRTVFQ